MRSALRRIGSHNKRYYLINKEMKRLREYVRVELTFCSCFIGDMSRFNHVSSFPITTLRWKQKVNYFCRPKIPMERFNEACLQQKTSHRGGRIAL